MKNLCPKCRAKKLVNFLSTFFVEIIIGIAIGMTVTSFAEFLVLVLLAQPLIWTAAWVTNKAHPKIHHLIEGRK